MDPISGVIGGLAVLVAQRVVDVPGEVRRNDERIHNRDSDLLTWTEDDNAALGTELNRVQNEMASHGLLYSGARISARQNARNLVIKRYTDQLRDAERVVRDVEVSERWAHGIWRRVKRQPMPELTTPEKVKPIVGDWMRAEPLPDDVANAA